MSDDLELARRAVACRAWRWRDCCPVVAVDAAGAVMPGLGQDALEAKGHLKQAREDLAGAWPAMVDFIRDPGRKSLKHDNVRTVARGALGLSSMGGKRWRALLAAGADAGLWDYSASEVLPLKAGAQVDEAVWDVLTAKARVPDPDPVPPPDPDAAPTCPACGSEVPAHPGAGRPRVFCSSLCRRYASALRAVLRAHPGAVAKVAAFAVREAGAAIRPRCTVGANGG
jgi:hypothetical protein